jgi:hypothetical protein
MEERHDDQRWVGATRVPNIVLWPVCLGVVALVGILGQVFVQDRGRLRLNEDRTGRLETSDAIQDKNIANLMSMWAEVKKGLDRIEARMP